MSGATTMERMAAGNWYTRFLVSSIVAFVCVGSALAQDPRTSQTQDVARTWLALTDRNDGAASWAGAGKQFQTAVTAARWAASLTQVRPPLGALVERAAESTQFAHNIPGAPDGDYAIVVYRTSFAHKALARESVTLAREADGNWRVIGYFIQ